MIMSTESERDKTVLTLCRDKQFRAAAKFIETWVKLEEHEIQNRIHDTIDKLEAEANGK